MQTVAIRSSAPSVISRHPLVSISSRAFASDAKSETFLPISEVTERVLNVVKNFEKVDPAKVRRNNYIWAVS